MENNNDLLALLEYIDFFDYQECPNVGMELEHVGYRAIDWDEWNRRDIERSY